MTAQVSLTDPDQSHVSVELTGVKEEELVAVPTPISSRDLWSLLLQRHPRYCDVITVIMYCDVITVIMYCDVITVIRYCDVITVIRYCDVITVIMYCDVITVIMYCDVITVIRWVEVGQASVVMAISSPHRHDGQQAIQHCISQLKAHIPIWKKEVYDTRDSSWKENAECSWAAQHELPVTEK
ncbi:Molybdopterin synthase catalytic subunit [Larimichthys crocea]|nr:Molybdopterin synthase catalytic subunit [Larimichthys crocea]